MRLFSNHDRPVHLGRFPLEKLPRDPMAAFPGGRLPRVGDGALHGLMAPYRALFESFGMGEPSSLAPIPPSPDERAANAKASAYFLDAAQVGICRLPSPQQGFTHALVILTATPSVPADEGAGAGQAMASLRAGEIAAVMANYFRRLGFPSQAEFPWRSDHLAELGWRAGLVAKAANGALVNPFLGDRYGLAAVLTAMDMTPDLPLAASAARLSPFALGVPAALGIGGASPAWEWRGDFRPRYPMRRVKRTLSPTTRIGPNIPRVPKRANFFVRARHGDLGGKAQREVARFAYKHPYAAAMMPLIQGMAPHQDGAVAAAKAGSDERSNTDFVRALAMALGGDMVGVTAARPHAWYSHHLDGRAIAPYHKYAIVILIDQGFETMEGASGDDWISGAQSMRAYMRGAEIAGILAAAIRARGYGARAQTNADSDVLHIPLILEAGLGELSRIGELVLNPYVGPRFKSVVVTTDLPLTVDQPIDFGLQDFCSKCNKCARECPCQAISFGPKIMFNGYEMWKPDVEKCARYRITNAKGSACGRCMKTCPYNTEGLLAHRFFLWLAMHVPVTRKWIARLDDKVGHGRRNPVKKWWYDLEIVDGQAVAPLAGTNARDLDFNGVVAADKQKRAIYPADTMPPPDAAEAFPVDRQEGLRRAEAAEFK